MELKSINSVVHRYIVGCRSVVQLGGLILGDLREVLLRLRLVSLFYSMEVPLKLKKIHLFDFVVTLFPV